MLTTTTIAPQVYHYFLILKILIDIRWSLAVQLLGGILYFSHHVLLFQMILICYFHK